MRLLSSLLLWLCLGCAATAQINPNQPAPKPSTGTAKPAGPKQFSGNSSILVVFDADCTLKVDNEVVGNFLAGDMWKSPIMAGSHVVECVLGDDKWRSAVECKSGQQLIVEAELGKVRAQLVQQETTPEADRLARNEEQRAAAAKAEAESNAAEELAERRRRDPFDADMVPIAGGSFTMGCTGEQGSDCSENEKPSHRVTVSTFYLSKYEVTQGLWTAVMGSNPSANAGCAQCPVEQVSWNDVQEFIRKLNAQSGKRYRLPTEAEWEYAARGGGQSGGTKYAGGNDMSSVGWDGNSGAKTHGVGQRAPNELGLYDMSGNVIEWCSDWYTKSYYGSSPSTDPQGPSSGKSRVVRGGSCLSSPQGCRVAFRFKITPDARYFYLGFRLARAE